MWRGEKGMDGQATTGPEMGYIDKAIFTHGIVLSILTVFQHWRFGYTLYIRRLRPGYVMAFWRDPWASASRPNEYVWATATKIYPVPTAVLALLIILVSYLAARLGGTMVVSSLGLSVLWPPSALLVAAMLLVPRRNWLVLIPAGPGGSRRRELAVRFHARGNWPVFPCRHSRVPHHRVGYRVFLRRSSATK